MNIDPASILALIMNLYEQGLQLGQQLEALTQENAELRAKLTKATDSAG